METHVEGPSLGKRLSQLLCDESLGAKTLFAKSGQVIFDFETHADRMFLIKSGQVRLFQNLGPQGARLLDILGPGQFFGITSLGNLERYYTRAVATGASSLCAMPSPRLLQLLQLNPAAAVELVALLVNRLKDSMDVQGQLITQSCENRLVQKLLHFSNSAAALPSGDDVVLSITHAQLAEAVGAARETVSVCLTNLRQRKLLRTGRNQLVFNPGLLRRMQEN